MSIGSRSYGRRGRRATALVAAGLLVGLGAPLLSTAVAAAAPATTAAAAATGGAASYRHGVVPTVSAAKAGPIHAASASNLVFGGGNGGIGVTTGAPRVYLVFWGSQWGTQSTNGQGYMTLSGDPYATAPDLQAFMKGLGTGSETWSGVMTQYCEGVATGAQTCPANAAHVGYPAGGALAGVWADTGAAAPSSATAHQLAVEAVNAANHFGNSTQAANRNTQYFIVSPTGVTPDGFNTPSGTFCAWHDFSGDPFLTGGAVNSPFAVAFTNMPYVTDAGGGCGMNFVNSGTAGNLDGVTIVGGHEYAETITDQFPVGGWLDQSPQQYENGDLCAWIAPGFGVGESQDISLTTGSFAVQTTWANDANGGTGGCLVSHPVVVNTGTAAPAITSANYATFTAGAAGTFTVTTTGTPVPTIAESGARPSGVSFTDNHDGTATLSGTAALGSAGSYPLTLTAANGAGANATQSFTLTVTQNPAISSVASTTFTVGVAGAFTVTATGSPAVAVTESGALPSGVTYNTVAHMLSGTPAQATAGSYPITFSAANGVGPTANQSFTLTVNQAQLTYPTDGQNNVDTTLPFTWSTIAQAQGYLLTVGSAAFGTNLVNSGILPAGQSSFGVPNLPSGVTLHATLYAEVSGSWGSYQAIRFTAAPGEGTFTFPLNGHNGVDPTRAITWSTIPRGQGYIVIIGTTQYGAQIASSGILPASQSSFAAPILPTGVTLYASLFTKVNGQYTRVQSITFTAGPAKGILTNPVQGQTHVAAPTSFTWSTIAGAQNYLLIVGTKVYGANVTNSGILPASQSSFAITTLPHGQILYASLFTKVNGTWTVQVVGFGT